MEGDWDSLIILDACRYDIYSEYYKESGSRVSLASKTRNYIKENFSEGDWSDVIYIAGNPQMYESIFKKLTGREVDDVFFEVYNTFDTDWDEDAGVVMPDSLVRDALTAEKLFPDKKKIIHFMQPHGPFVGSNLDYNSFTGIAPDHRDEVDSSIDFDRVENGRDEDIFVEAEMGNVSRDKLLQAYRQNLEFVLPFVEELGEKLSGRVVVTADHGELLGEGGIYGHHDDCKARAIREVPYHVVSRRD